MDLLQILDILRSVRTVRFIFDLFYFYKDQITEKNVFVVFTLNPAKKNYPTR